MLANIVNQNTKVATFNVDLSKLAVIDNATVVTTANLATAVDAGKQVIIESFANCLGLNKNESFIITDVVINKVSSSDDITSSAITNTLKIQRIAVESGLNTSKPTITAGQNETIALATLSVANVGILNVKPLTVKDLTDTAGSLTARPYAVRNTDLGVAFKSGGAIAIYAGGGASDTITGVVTVSLYFKALPR